MHVMFLEGDSAGLELPFSTYKILFPALVDAGVTVLGPVKRYRGAHAGFTIPPERLGAALSEVAAVRLGVREPEALAYLDALAALIQEAQRVGRAVVATSP